MADNVIDKMNISVCDMPDGNGLTVEHMPDFLLKEGLDNCAPHTHYFYEILWFQEGNGTHTIDFVDYEVRPDTIFFISPGQIHHFDRPHGYRGVTIKMCKSLMKDSADTCALFMMYDVFHTFDSTPYYYITPDTATALHALVGQIEEESGRNGAFGNAEVLESLLRILLVKIIREGRKDGSRQLSSAKPSHILFIRFRKAVEQEYARLHTVQEYASMLNVSQRTLYNCVSECADMSPLSFINGRIMLEAKRLVRYTNMLIKEIAFTLGYEDPSYFVKLFKRHTGYLPSDFREADNV